MLARNVVQSWSVTISLLGCSWGDILFKSNHANIYQSNIGSKHELVKGMFIFGWSTGHQIKSLLSHVAHGRPSGSDCELPTLEGCCEDNTVWSLEEWPNTNENDKQRKLQDCPSTWYIFHMQHQLWLLVTFKPFPQCSLNAETILREWFSGCFSLCADLQAHKEAGRNNFPKPKTRQWNTVQSRVKKRNITGTG